MHTLKLVECKWDRLSLVVSLRNQINAEYKCLHCNICLFDNCLNMKAERAVNAKLDTKHYCQKFTRIRRRRAQKVSLQGIKAKDFSLSFADLEAVHSTFIFKVVDYFVTELGAASDFSTMYFSRTDKSSTYLNLSS